MFSFPSIPEAGRRAALARILPALALLPGLALPPTLAAQFPGQLRGRVVDHVTGRPVPGAEVALPAPGRRLQVDGRGRFRFRGLEPGDLRVEATALGYAPGSTTVEVRNGAEATAVIRLRPRALPVDGVGVRARRSRDPSVRVVEGEALRAGGAATLGDLLQDVPGVVLRSRGGTGGETVSIRGSDADEVLVLVDGAPLNDPLTGVADVSSVAAAVVERVTVLPGARSARYGSRAQAGVVEVETRAGRRAPGVALRAGSLGRRGAEIGASGSFGGVRGGGTAEALTSEGDFGFRVPEEVGGGRARRRNADLARLTLQGGVDADAGPGDLRIRAGLEALERGLPGKSFAPSDSARQELLRGRVSARWRTGGEAGSLTTSAYLVEQRLRSRDPAAPLGTPYDDDTRFRHGGLRVEAAWRTGPPWLEPLSAGLDLDHRRVRSDVLSAGNPGGRTDGGAWIRSGIRRQDGGWAPGLDATLRLHRDAAVGAWRGSHEITASARPGPVSLHLTHRSAFSPPTLGDQFFREGVGVRPNPDLRAERVPSELAAGVSMEGAAAGLRLRAGASAYRGDVDDMIVWAPDFRFVWSPRNVDVRRSGLDAWVGLRHRATGLSLDADASLARVVYDRPGPDTVQLRYRPRYTGRLRAAWERGRHAVAVEARYTGVRYPVPAPVNGLPAFWTVDLDLRRDWRFGGWTMRTALGLDRLLDRTDAFIFGFPEPGRTVEVRVEVARP